MRRLPMLLLTETCVRGLCLRLDLHQLLRCVWLLSARRCSTQVSGSASAALRPMQPARQFGDEGRRSSAGPSAPCRR